MSPAPSGTARVHVPASTSNLGAGFDCIGFALDLELTAGVDVGDDAGGGAAGQPRVEVRREGTLTALDTPPDEDLLYVGFAAACRERGRPVPRSLVFTASSEIPVARGLGSSSAALVAGAALANAVLELGATRTDLANLCARLEGHPDNVAPAIFGGAVLGVPLPAGDGAPPGYTFAPMAVHDQLAFVFVVPDFHVTTSDARAVLPATLDYRTAVAAAAKGAALVEGLANGDPALLAYALDDVLHVPFRRGLVTGYAQVATAAVESGAFGATLSGSGSSLVAVTLHERAKAVGAAMERAWLRCDVSSRAFVQARPGVARLRGAEEKPGN